MLVLGVLAATSRVNASLIVVDPCTIAPTSPTCVVLQTGFSPLPPTGNAPTAVSVLTDSHGNPVGGFTVQGVSSLTLGNDLTISYTEDYTDHLVPGGYSFSTNAQDGLWNPNPTGPAIDLLSLTVSTYLENGSGPYSYLVANQQPATVTFTFLSGLQLPTADPGPTWLTGSASGSAQVSFNAGDSACQLLPIPSGCDFPLEQHFTATFGGPGAVAGASIGVDFPNQSQVTPEPGSWALAGAGIWLFARRARRQGRDYGRSKSSAEMS
jgi:hypothetical protein